MSDPLALIFVMILLTILSSIFLRRWIVKKQFFLSRNPLITLLVIYVSLICLFIAAILLADHNIYFRGYRSTSFIFIGMCVIGIICNLFYPPVKKTVPLIFISLQAIALVICSIAGFILTWEVALDYNNQIYYNDKKYRVEETFRGIMAPCGLPTLFIKNGFFEKKYALDEAGHWGICFRKEEIKSVIITQLSADSVSVNIYHSKEDSLVPNPLIKTIRLSNNDH